MTARVRHVPPAEPDLKSGPPARMELRSQRTNGDGLKDVVEHVEADDDDRPRLRHLRAGSRIETGPPDLIALHPRRSETFFRRKRTRGSAIRAESSFSQGIESKPSASRAARSPQSSEEAAMARAVSSQESLAGAPQSGRSRIPSIVSSITTAAPIRNRSRGPAGSRTPREFPIRVILSSFVLM